MAPNGSCKVAYNPPLLDRPSREIEPVDDITCRQFVIGAAAIGVLAACGSDGDDQAAPTSAPATRTITTPLGTDDIPTTPQRVITISTGPAGRRG